MKIHDFRLNYYIKHCAVILLTAWCFICLMEMPFNISCGINPVSDISSVPISVLPGIVQWFYHYF